MCRVFSEMVDRSAGLTIRVIGAQGFLQMPSDNRLRRASGREMGSQGQQTVRDGKSGIR